MNSHQYQAMQAEKTAKAVAEARIKDRQAAAKRTPVQITADGTKYAGKHRQA